MSANSLWICHCYGSATVMEYEPRSRYTQRICIQFESQQLKPGAVSVYELTHTIASECLGSVSLTIKCVLTNLENVLF